MKLTIDPALCAGHGRCYEVAPDLIGDDDQGNGEVRISDVPSELKAQAERAVTSCPERAVTLA